MKHGALAACAVTLLAATAASAPRASAHVTTTLRNYDDGKTWIMGFQKIEARRIGPPRLMGALAPARKAAAPAPKS